MKAGQTGAAEKGAVSMRIISIESLPIDDGWRGEDTAANLRLNGVPLDGTALRIWDSTSYERVPMGGAAVYEFAHGNRQFSMLAETWIGPRLRHCCWHERFVTARILPCILGGLDPEEIIWSAADQNGTYAHKADGLGMRHMTDREVASLPGSIRNAPCARPEFFFCVDRSRTGELLQRAQAVMAEGTTLYRGPGLGLRTLPIGYVGKMAELRDLILDAELSDVT